MRDVSDSDRLAGGVGAETTADGARTPFLLVTWSMPPTASGSSIICRNLAKWFEPDECVMLGQVLYENHITLDGIEDHVRVEIPDTPFNWRVKRLFDPPVLLPMLVKRGLEAVRNYGLRAVVACYPNTSHMLAGLQIARRAGIPYFPWYHNLYVETRTNAAEALLAPRVQRYVFGRSERVLSINEGLDEYVRDRYDVDTVLLPTCLNAPIPDDAEPAACSPPYTIGLSGNMNFTTLRPLQNLIRAVGGDPDYRIVLHTPTPLRALQQGLDGVWAPNIELRACQTQGELIESLGRCDMLVLGLTDTPDDRMLLDFMTQFPIRTYEMLVSMRPILLLSPREYFLAKFFDGRGCGLVTDDTEPDAIRSHVETLCTNQAARARYVSGALSAAREFEGSKVAEALREELRRAAPKGA